MDVLFNILLIIIGVLLFELIIFSHEMGHFLTAKLFGVKVNEFALGMGPKIFSRKKGETTYSLRAFPIGGFCSMEGEDEDSDDERAFNKKAVWKRMIIIIAGATMNIILGLIMMFCYVVQQPYFATTTIATFDESKEVLSTYESGLRVNDTIKSVDGYGILTINDFSFAVGTMEGDTTEVVVERDGERIVFDEVKFDLTENEDGTNSINLDFKVYGQEKTVLSVLSNTVKDSVSMIKMVWSSLVGIVTGKFGINDVSGPIGAAQTATQVASAGLERSFLDAVNSILNFMIIITINLGIFNMLPIPALDGGRFFFLLVEAIRRKPIPQKYEAVIHAAGLVILLIFMVLITFKDIFKIFTG